MCHLTTDQILSIEPGDRVFFWGAWQTVQNVFGLGWSAGGKPVRYVEASEIPGICGGLFPVTGNWPSDRLRKRSVQ